MQSPRSSRRVAALTAELTAAGSVYASVAPGSQVDFSVRLIDAELVARPA
jgi:hypothetical protein